MRGIVQKMIRMFEFSPTHASFAESQSEFRVAEIPGLCRESNGSGRRPAEAGNWVPYALSEQPSGNGYDLSDNLRILAIPKSFRRVKMLRVRVNNQCFIVESAASA